MLLVASSQYIAQSRMTFEVRNAVLPRLMLIDDHVLFRTGMRLILGDGHLKLAEPLEAGSIAEALTTPLSIDVVLLDVELPGISGMDGLALIKRRWPQAVIVMLTANDDPTRMRLALERGAQSFVSKKASAEHIRRVVQQALTGKLKPEKLSTPQLALLEAAGTAQQQQANASAGALSARQIDVLLLMCEGLSNKAIANRLFLSENTVRNHVVSVLRYFDANTRTEAVTLAQRGGVIQLRPVT